MKALKIVLISVGSLIILIIILNIIFFFGMAQKKAQPFEVNSPDLDKKVLIATQGSNFKKTLVSNIAENLKGKSVYIKVIDVGSLPEMKNDKWNAILIINSIEMGKMASGINEFLSKANNYDNIILLNVSNVKNISPEYNVDVISSASKKENVDELAKKILSKINALL